MAHTPPVRENRRCLIYLETAPVLSLAEFNYNRVQDPSFSQRPYFRSFQAWRMALGPYGILGSLAEKQRSQLGWCSSPGLDAENLRL
jgi:hypothetical protein